MKSAPPPILTLEAAVSKCKNCAFFVEGEKKCKAFAIDSSVNSNASSSDEFITILEARRDPRLCGIESKMMIPLMQDECNTILNKMYDTAYGIYVMERLFVPIIVIIGCYYIYK